MKQKSFKVTITVPDSDEVSGAYANRIRDLVHQDCNDPKDLPGEPWEVEATTLETDGSYEGIIDWLESHIKSLDEELGKKDDAAKWGIRNGFMQARDELAKHARKVCVQDGGRSYGKSARLGQSLSMTLGEFREKTKDLPDSQRMTMFVNGAYYCEAIALRMGMLWSHRKQEEFLIIDKAL